MEGDIRVKSITCDNKGHLFACDINNKCIQVFDVDDGKYLGPLTIDGNREVRCMLKVRWCSALNVLVVLHAPYDGDNDNDDYYFEKYSSAFKTDVLVLKLK